VVYGHTIYDRPELATSRIGIDTGAYNTGRLTALGLEGTSRWFIETGFEDGTVRVSQRSIA
jgi:serine/threonine protein phosphatase 1